MINRLLLRTALVAGVLTIPVLSGCDSANSGDNARASTAAASSQTLEVYKSPTCGCCEDWQDHMAEHGMPAEVHHPQDLNAVKADYGIGREYQSCHTAVTEEGYVIEGHVPAVYVQRFLNDPPEDAVGLAVPGMPLGSPGMEIGDRFQPYDILLLTRNGEHRVYASVKEPEQQYSK